MWLGKVGRFISGGLILFFCITVNGQVTKSVRLSDENNRQIDHAIKEDGSFVINYCLPELILSTLENNNGEFYRINVPGHINTSLPGKPELPVYTFLIALPDNPTCKIKISEVKTRRIKPSGKKIDGILYPAQESQVKKIQKENQFVIDRDTYAKKGFLTGDTVKIEHIGKAGSSNLGNLIISPVQYNPRSNILEAITSMKIEVDFNEPVDMKSVSRNASYFDLQVTKGLMNISRDLIPDYTNKPVGMIILTDTAFRKQLQPFIRWKTQKGFRVKVLYKGAAFAGTTASQIKEAIAKIYNSPGVNETAADYLLIIGDIDRVPCFGTGTTSNYTDMYYGEFTGEGDYIPELYIGRIPAKDTSEVRSALNKIIQIEKFEFGITNKFYRNALATTGFDNNNSIFMNGQIRYLTMNYLLSANNINEKHFYHYTGSDPDNWLKIQKDSIVRIINGGVSFINYSGHGDETGWLHLDITSADSASFKNRNMYPVIISNACRTGTFNLSNSFGNRLVLEKNRGAAGFIGCSNDSYWNEDYFWTVGVGTVTDNPVYTGKNLGSFDRLFHTHNEYPSDWYYSLGQINYAGNLSVSSSTSLRKKYYWETYNVIGDPSMMPFTGEPKGFNISLPDTLPNGIKSLYLEAEPFAYVAVSHFDTLWDASFSSLSGGVTLDMPGLTNDSCLIVVTGQNRIPIKKKVYFANVRREFLNLNSVELNDQQGNNNKKADFREQLYLSLTLSNMGLTDADSVYAKISTSSDWLRLVKDSAYIGRIQNRTTIAIPDKLLIGIADTVPDMGIAPVRLLVRSAKTEKQYSVDLEVHSPVLRISNYMIDDTGTGNGDHIADQGEIFKLIFRVRNDGSSDAVGQFNITSINPGITLIESGVTDRLIKAGQVTDIPLMVQLSENLSSGSFIDISSRLNSYPFQLSRDFTFRIGKTRESFEAMSFNIFPWINNSAVPWKVTSLNYYEGALSAQSGAITHLGSSSLTIKAIYPASDTLKFTYKVSCEPNYDYLAFMVNGKEILKKSGETGWMKAAIPVSEGLSKLEWIYRKDNSITGGSDCAWIDMIDFSKTSSVKYVRKDLQVARIVTPISKNHIGQALLKVKLLNTGRDTIKGFNLAYSVDNKTPVTQSFKEIITPGKDSLEVTFKTKANLSKYGLYILSVFGYDNQDDYLGNDTISLEYVNTEINEALIVYPNPVLKDVTVFINSLNQDNIRITVSNSAGVSVYTAEQSIAAGGNIFTIPGEHLVPATYYLNIKGSMIKRTVPFIKIK